MKVNFIKMYSEFYSMTKINTETLQKLPVNLRYGLIETSLINYKENYNLTPKKLTLQLLIDILYNSV